MMLFIKNKYTKWYNNIVTNAQNRVNQKEYTEKHHIIPKSLGGSNSQCNIVKLTAKEHFVCHRLLVKMTEGESKRKMAHAAWCMSNLKNSYQQRYKVNSITYAKIKSEYKIDPTIYEKVSAKLKGRKFPPRTAEHSAKLGRYIRTPEHRLKLSNFRKSQTGVYKRSNETKKKMSEWQKGVPKPKITCRYCGKSNNLVNHIRWHDKKCKFFIYYN